MRGFRFWSSRVGLWPTKLLVEREEKPLVPRVVFFLLNRSFFEQTTLNSDSLFKPKDIWHESTDRRNCFMPPCCTRVTGGFV